MAIADRNGTLSRGPRHAAAVITTVRKLPHVKLTMDKAREIRRDYAEHGNAAETSRRFGISHAHACRIVNNVWWREPSPFPT